MWKGKAFVTSFLKQNVVFPSQLHAFQVLIYRDLRHLRADLNQVTTRQAIVPLAAPFGPDIQPFFQADMCQN